MNIKDTGINNSAFQDKYSPKLKELEDLQSAFKKMAETAKKAQKNGNGTKKGKATLVTAATKKSEIQRLIKVLNQKITEIQLSDEDDKVKSYKTTALQMKIASMQRLLSKLEQKERKKMQESSEKIKRKSEKKINDKIYLSKEDLTLNGKNDTLQTSSYDSNSSGVNIQGGLDIIAGLNNAVTPDTNVSTIDMGL